MELWVKTLSIRIVLTLLLIGLTSSVQAQVDDGHNGVGAILERIEHIFESGCPEGSHNNPWICAADYRKQLAEHNDGVVAGIQARIARSDASPLNTFLLFCLRERNTPDVDQLLLNYYFDRPALSKTAQGELQARARLGHPVGVRVSEERLAHLITSVNTGSIGEAGDGAQLLAILPKNPIDERCPPVVKRFVKAVGEPNPAIAAHHAYMPPRYLVLNWFLQAFEDFGEAAQPYLRKAVQDTPPAQAEETKWLSIALGMTSDSEQTSKLEKLVRDDADTHLRYLAILAYAKAGGEKTIPTLQSWLNDESTSDFYREPDGSSFYPIRAASKRALALMKMELGG